MSVVVLQVIKKNNDRRASCAAVDSLVTSALALRKQLADAAEAGT